MGFGPAMPCGISVVLYNKSVRETSFLSVILILSLSFVLGCSRNGSYDLEPGTAFSPSSEVVTGAVSGEITWSGYTWEVKSYEKNPVGPGPNYFSGGINNVWVDRNGNLHLKITNQNGRWYCAELATKKSFGYGTYRFYPSTRFDNLDKNIVVGLFTWDNTSSAYYNREIDIEFARWGDLSWPALNYTVQPGGEGNNRSKDIVMTGDYSTHSFNWRQNSIIFQSIFGHYSSLPGSGYLMDEWTYAGADIPKKGNEKVRINLWLMSGLPPSEGKETEFVIERFEFVP